MSFLDRFRWRKEAAPVPARREPTFDAPPQMSAAAMAAVVEAIKQRATDERAEKIQNPFRIAQHPPEATPKKPLQMAMDSGGNWASNEWSTGALNSVAAEGLFFPGYPYLALLSQRPEYRVISETIATEATRKWIEFKGTGNGDSDPSDRIKELTDEFERLEVRDRFAELAAQDGLFGRSHLYLDFGTDLDKGSNELKTPIGDGQSGLSTSKVKKGSLRRLQTVEAVWTYPTTYNATNPLKEDWYKPQVWYAMGTEIHCSRLLTFIGHPVPDLLKPAYSFGGMSLSQLAEPYVNIWLQTRESVGRLIHSFSVMVLMTDLQTILQSGNVEGLLQRVAMFNALRDNQGTFVVNKNSEDFKNVSASLAGLHELQAQSQEHMMSVARIPAVKFTGIQPTGLNASSEGEIRVFYDTIHAYQGMFFRPNLQKVVNFVQLSLWGKIDPDITWDFVPLWSMNEKEQAEIRKLDAETGQILVDDGAVSQEEERKRVANDPESPYQSLDVDDLPDLIDEEQAGLVPAHGRVDPKLVEEGDEDDNALNDLFDKGKKAA